MPTIALASPKGGAGKSSAAALLGSDLAERGATVTIIDADPNHPLARWGKRPGPPDNLKVIETNSEEQLVDTIEDAARKTAFVIIDLEGTASSAVGVAMSRADLVVIPTKGVGPRRGRGCQGDQVHPLPGEKLSAGDPVRRSLHSDPAGHSSADAGRHRDRNERAGYTQFGTQLHERDLYCAIFALAVF